MIVRMMRGGMPDLHTVVEDVVAAGDKVVWRFTMRGTHTGGDVVGIPAGSPLICSRIRTGMQVL